MHDARLCSAELVVMRGDLRILRDPQTAAHHRRGLRARLAAALGTLNWLCRRHIAAYRTEDPELSVRVGKLRDALQAGKLPAVARQLEFLTARFPLSLDGLDPSLASEGTVSAGERLYLQYCAGCHDRPDLDTDAPAYSLFSMARRQPLEEFIARMLIGVHGTGEISLRNPLSDLDIAGMTAYFLAAPPR